MIVVMSRVPLPGQTKTRLMPYLSGEECVKLQQAFLEDLITLLVATVKLPACLFYTPRDQEQCLATLVAGRLPLVPQEGADLGVRMAAAVSWSLQQQGLNGVIVVGSDLPTLPASVILDAKERLEQQEIVLGPTFDGGYYLIGMRNYFPAVFEGISWGTERVLGETLERIAQSGLTVALLKTLNDIDTYEDLLALRRELAEAAAIGSAYPYQTYMVLTEIFSNRE
jgi:hypothetical protein